MKTIHKQRLLKLAGHLRNGKLGHKKFDFSTYNCVRDFTESYDKRGCGTVSCALGECPIVFSDAWKFRPWHEPVLKRFKCATTSARRFFALSEDEAMHLFYPDEQRTKRFGGKKLRANASRRSVAANIEAFVKRKERE